MVPWRATDDGEVTSAVVDWYARFAKGRPGVIVVEATGIRDIPSGPLLRIGHDRYIEGLRKIVQAVHEASDGQTRLFIQLIDFLSVRRRPSAEKFFRRYLKISDEIRRRAARVFGSSAENMSGDDEALRAVLLGASEEDQRAILGEREWESLERGYRERVTDVHLPQIRDLPARLPTLFADGAARAMKAGFDGVELHYAHAYTMASFLSALNTRADGYGGSREERVRLPLEVFQAVRDRVGKSFAVGARFLGDDVVEGGSRLEDAIYFAERFGAAGFDFLSISKGGRFEDAKRPKEGHAVYPYTGPSGHECMPTVKIDERGPFGRNIPLAAAIKSRLRELGHRTPIVAAGGICSPWQAEEILAAGDADIVAAARQSLADPDWFRKVRLGYGEQVRRCFFTNYCEALDQKHVEVTCQRWDREFDVDAESVARTRDGKRRLTAPAWSPER
jgi:2,4-dienoyl-CoA reductase-like NADH-dependent reductase (Old Yellow Enzyme family)